MTQRNASSFKENWDSQSQLYKESINEELIRLIQIPPPERTEEDIEKLMKETESFPFFKNFKAKKRYKDFNAHKKCCQHMTYEFYPRMTTVYHENTKGDKLYFVLSGRLKSYAKTLHTTGIDKQKASNDDFKLNMSHVPLSVSQKIGSVSVNQSSISPPKSRISPTISNPKSIFPGGPRLNTYFTTELELQPQGKQSKSPKVQNQPKVPQEKTGNENQEKGPEGAMGSSFIQINESSNRKRSIESVFKTEVEMTVENQEIDIEQQEVMDGEITSNAEDRINLGNVEAGQTFGEVSVVLGNKRQETIVTLEDCHLGVLNKESFDWIMLPLERGKLKKQMDFFDIVFGLTLTWDKAITLMHLVNREPLKKGQIIFKDKEKTNGFYIVKSGDVLIYKDIEYTQQLEDKPELSLEDKLEKLSRAETPLQIGKKNTMIKKAKYPVQLLSRGDFFGEEVLLNFGTRGFSAECKSDSVVLYHIPGYVIDQIETFLWHMRDYVDAILQKARERIEWRNNRLNDSEKYINKVLKPSRNLQSCTNENPFIRRTFAKDIPVTYAILTNEPRQFPNSSIRVVDDKSKGSVPRKVRVQSANKEAPKSSRSIIETNVINNQSSLGDSFTLLQYMNKANMQTLSQYQASDPESMKNPFNIENGLIFDPAEEGISSRKLKIMMKARLEQKSPKKNEIQRRGADLDSSSILREAISRIGPKLKEVTKDDLKVLIKSPRNHEQFRQRIVRCSTSEKSSRSGSQVGVMFMKVNGLEPSGEKNSVKKSVESFINADLVGNHKKEIREKEILALLKGIDGMKNKSSLSALNQLNLSSRASIGCLTSRETLSCWQDMGIEGKVKKDKVAPMILNLPKNRQEEVNMTFFKVLDMMSFGGALGKEGKARKMNRDKELGGQQVEEAYGNGMRKSNKLEVNGSWGYSASSERRAARDRIAKSLGGPLEFGRLTDTTNIEDTAEETREKKQESEEKDKKDSRWEEKERLREQGNMILEDDEEMSVREWGNCKTKEKKGTEGGSHSTVLRRTKHNMFRFRSKNCSRSESREESSKRKTLL